MRGARPDAFGAVIFAAAIALLTGAIVEGPDWGWGSPRIAGGFAVSAALWRSSCGAPPAIRLR